MQKPSTTPTSPQEPPSPSPAPDSNSPPSAGNSTPRSPKPLKLQVDDLKRTTPPSSPLSSPQTGAIKLFVGQIPKDWPVSRVEGLFSNLGISILEARPIINQTTLLPQGCAFVTVASMDEATRAMFALHNKVQTAPGKWLQVRLAFRDTGRLFVTGTGPLVDEKYLYEYFSKHGTVLGTHILRTPFGESKGCAIVEFDTKESATAVMGQLDGQIVMPGAATAIRLEWARGGKDSPLARHMSSPRSALSPLGVTVVDGAQFRNFPPTPHGGDYSAGYDEGPATPRSVVEEEPQSQQQQQQQPFVYYPSPVAFVAAPVSSSMYMPPASPAGFFVASQPVYSPVLPHHTLLPVSPSSPSGSKRRFAEGPPGANLFVSGFSRDFTDSDMYALFSPYGALLSWMIFFDKFTMRSKCFGFVSFERVEDAERARTALNRKKIAHFTLFVTLKQKEDGYSSPNSSSAMDSPNPLGAQVERKKAPTGQPSGFKLEV